MKTEVLLEDLTFYGYHGVYEDERKSGNRFSVDVKIVFDIPEKNNFDDLDNTVNYEEVYSIVKECMTTPSRLLENIAKKIADDVFVRWTTIKSAEVSVSKYAPPIGGPCRRTKVTIVKTR